MVTSPGWHPLPASSPLCPPKHTQAPRSSKKLFLSFLNNVKMPRKGLNQRPLQGPSWSREEETRDGGSRSPKPTAPVWGLEWVRRGLHCAKGLQAQEFSSVPRKVALQGRARGFLPHLAPRGLGVSGEPSGRLDGGGPGPPVWHVVGDGESPASGASPEAASVVVAVAPSSTDDSTLNPSSGGAGESGLRMVNSPRGLRTEGVGREMELLGR